MNQGRNLANLVEAVQNQAEARLDYSLRLRGQHTDKPKRLWYIRPQYITT